MTVPSASSLIRGLRVEETYAVFRSWDFEKTDIENFIHIESSDVMGVGSSHSQAAFLAAIRRRYDFQGVDRPLVEMARNGVSFDVFKPALLWHVCRTETVLKAFLVEWVYPRFIDDKPSLRRDDVLPFVEELAQKRIVTAGWQPVTQARVASALLTMVSEVGLIKGKAQKEFCFYRLSEEAFLYLLHAMTDIQPNAREVVHSKDWRMFLMSPDEVERELYRLHQYRRVHYEVAGSIAQLTLPCSSAADYVKEMVA